MQISISPELEAIITQQLAIGYASPEEVVAEALRQMNSQYQQKRLRQALIDGENSGDAVECDLDALEEESLRELAMGQVSVSPDVCPHA